MKNIAVLSVLVIILSANSYAEENEKNYCFSLGPQFGFIYGQAMEYVYSLPKDTKNEFLSELIWDMKPVFYLGIQGEYGRTDLMKAPGFFSSLSFKVGIPADSGVMEDRDWLWPSNANLTRFSSHTNKTDAYIQLDAAVGASFPIISVLYLKPFISGSWMRFSFAGRDGYGIYNDSNPKEQNFSGAVISYRQDWLLLAFGLKAGTKIFYPFSFEVSFQISPLTYCSAIDTHLLRNIVFRDITEYGLFMEPSLKMYFLLKHAELSLGLNYRYIGKTKGESYAKMNNANYALESNKAGAGLSMWDINFLVNFRL
ncbi:omptin family outer membrane protease [Treponema sp. R6D11]